MQVQRQTTVTLMLSETEYATVCRALVAAAQGGDAGAAHMAAALGVPHGLAELFAAVEIPVNDGTPPQPIDPSTLPPDDPRRIEFEAMHNRYGGPAPALVDTSPG